MRQRQGERQSEAKTARPDGLASPMKSPVVRTSMMAEGERVWVRFDDEGQKQNRREARK
jgi:hypothetical protein